MFGYELHRRLVAASRSTIAIAAHPGYTNSELMRNVWSPLQPLVRVMSPWFGQTPAQGALPQLVAFSARSHDVAMQKRLWAASEQLTGIRFPV